MGVLLESFTQNYLKTIHYSQPSIPYCIFGKTFYLARALFINFKVAVSLGHGFALFLVALDSIPSE